MPGSIRTGQILISVHASIASNHITRFIPDWFLTYGDKKYFDPG